MSLLLVLLFVAASDPTPDCSRCHSENGWKEVKFNHNQTRFPLRDRHAALDCRVCHAEVHQLALDYRCQGCHRDPHAGRLGQFCDRCHDQQTWRSGAGVMAHSQTRFPLNGRHALVPCEECHLGRSDRTYGGVPSSCQTCHSNDLIAGNSANVDHSSLGASPDCRRCHETISWRRALLPDHEKCFPLRVGRHRNITCRDCHSTVTGLKVKSCSTFTAACSRCHNCNAMDNLHKSEEHVAGYQCADRKCYECHPTGGSQ